LTLRPCDAAGTPSGDSSGAPPFLQIGADQGLLPAPLERHFLVAAPAERFDFVLDFTGAKEAYFVMTNDAPAPYTKGGQIAAEEVMLFKVTKPLTAPDTST
jgi:spore coat protein A, manganese oxidase